ncbi:MAG: N-acetylgalactosamine-6-sulfatase, partial [Planctomycetota bacterium]|nr:N-acetylgalactosamine-6-sulfatase [Planctomycetota bacterium]
PPDRDSFYGVDDLPDLALRSGRWKLLCEYDGSDAELYNLQIDRSESNNVAAENLHIVAELTQSLLAWHKSMPSDNGANFRDLAAQSKGK